MTFVITENVLAELRIAPRRWSEKSSVLTLVNNAIRRGVLHVRRDSELPSATPLSGSSDDSILLVLTKARQKGEALTLATDDKDLRRAGSGLGVSVVDGSTLQWQLRSAGGTDTALAKDADEVRGRQRRNLAASVVSGAAAGFLGNLCATKLSVIAATASVWGTLLLILGAGFAFYWVRGRARLMYGTAELVFGYGVAARIFWPNFAYSQLTAVEFIQVIGGVYIMVRGLDNMGEGIKRTRWHMVWERFSGRQ